jgi:hypothetical protein
MRSTPGVCVIILFTALIYGFSLKARAFVLGKPLMFATKAGDFQVLHPRVGSGLTRKHYTRLVRLAWDKH